MPFGLLFPAKGPTDDELIANARKGFKGLRDGSVTPDDAQLALSAMLTQTFSTIRALDETGESSDAKMQAEFDAAVKIGYRHMARASHRKLLRAEIWPDKAMREIDAYLKLAEDTKAALGDKGETAGEMARALTDTCNNFELLLAKKHLRQLIDGSEHADTALENIKLHLAEAKKYNPALSEASLDDSGTLNAEKIAALAKTNYLFYARDAKAQLAEKQTSPDSATQRIDRNLTKGKYLAGNGAPDYSWLAENGDTLEANARPAADALMRAEIVCLSDDYYLDSACKTLSRIKKFEIDGNLGKAMVENYLKKGHSVDEAGNINYAPLNPPGGWSSALMQKELETAVYDSYINVAMQAWKDMSEGDLYPRTALQKIDGALAAIGKSYSDLPHNLPEGTNVKDHLQAISNFKYVGLMQHYWKDIQNGNAIPSQYVPKIRQCLQDSGCDAGMVDETGIIKKEQMEQELNRLEKIHQRLEPKVPIDPSRIGAITDESMKLALAQYASPDPSFKPETPALTLARPNKTPIRAA